MVPATAASKEFNDEDLLYTRLGNHRGYDADDDLNHQMMPSITFPLCGMGVGNLQHDLIQEEITKAVSDQSMSYRLIDTAHASRNEKLIADGIFRAGILTSEHDGDSNVEIHVITKIWYTYLGYERTLISVKESLKQLALTTNSNKNNNSIIRVHMLLHWPRCREDISWMNRELEESQLPDEVKNAGPPPHLNKDNAYLQSWKALEDIYLGEMNIFDGDDSDLDSSKMIASIGVSNFDLNDLQGLLQEARVAPHVLQGHVWSYVFDPYLINFCNDHNIHFQAYNVMNGIYGNQQNAPNAYDSLRHIANELSVVDKKKENYFTPAQIILKWLIQNNVSTIPRTTTYKHLQENSPTAISELPLLNETQQEKVFVAVRALLRGQDLDQPTVSFHNMKDNGNVSLYWKSHNGELISIKNDMEPGEQFETRTYPGHVFVVLHDDKQQEEHTVGVFYGEIQQIHINDEL